MLSSEMSKSSTSATALFTGLDRAARRLAVYASQPALPTTTQDSLLGGAHPSQAGLSPAGSKEKFQRYWTITDLLHLVPFCQACLAQ